MTDTLSSLIPTLIHHHLPGRAITRITDRGEWVRRIFAVELDGSQTVFVKWMTHPDWLDSTHQSRIVSEILHAKGLAAPTILAADNSKTLVPLPYVIETQHTGTRLDRLLPQLDPAQQLAVWRAVGDYYRVLHTIPGPRSGVWIDDPNVTFDITPNDFYLDAEIKGGSGQKLVEEGCLSENTHAALIALWRQHLAELKDHPPVMVHASPFLWTIYLEQAAGTWRVSSITAIGDTLWWDAAYDLAMLRWPPFSEPSETAWLAFAAAYGPLPSERRLKLYHLLQCLMAATNAFMAPQTPQNAAWLSRTRATLDARLTAIMQSL